MTAYALMLSAFEGSVPYGAALTSLVLLCGLVAERSAGGRVAFAFALAFDLPRVGLAVFDALQRAPESWQIAILIWLPFVVTAGVVLANDFKLSSLVMLLVVGACTFVLAPRALGGPMSMILGALFPGIAIAIAHVRSTSAGGLVASAVILIIQSLRVVVLGMCYLAPGLGDNLDHLILALIVVIAVAAVPFGRRTLTRASELRAGARA